MAEDGPSRSIKDASGNGHTGAVQDSSKSKWPASALAGGRYAKAFGGRYQDTVRVTGSLRTGMPSGNGPRTVSYWFKDIQSHPGHPAGDNSAFGMGCKRENQAWNINMKNSERATASQQQSFLKCWTPKSLYV